MALPKEATRAVSVAAKITQLRVTLEAKHAAALEKRHGWLLAKPLASVLDHVEEAERLAQEERI